MLHATPTLALLAPKNRRRALGLLLLASAAAYGAARQQRRAARARQSAKPPTGSAKRGSGGTALKELLPLLLRVAGRKVLVIVLLAVCRTALSNRLARLQGHLFRAAFLRRVPLFMRNLAENLALCGVAAALEATSRSWVARMELQWRRLLTDRLHGAYFADMVRVEWYSACDEHGGRTIGILLAPRTTPCACLPAADLLQAELR